MCTMPFVQADRYSAVRFDVFKVDLGVCELRETWARVHIPQPFHAVDATPEESGEVVRMSAY